MKQLFVSLFLLLALSLSALTAHDEEASIFFQLNSPEEDIKESLAEQIDLLLPFFVSGIEEALGYSVKEDIYPSMQDLLLYIFEEELVYDQIEELSLPLIKSQFTLRELRELNMFFAVGAGKKYLDLYVLNNYNYLASAMESYFLQLSEDEEAMERVGMQFLEIFLRDYLEEDSEY